MLFVYIVKISHLKKFKFGSFLLREEEERRRWLKKKRKKKKELAQRRKTQNQSIKRRNNSSVKATGTGGAPRWRPDFEQRSRRQTKICHT